MWMIGTSLEMIGALGRISKEDEGSWLSDKPKPVIGVLQNSAMLKHRRQLRKAAEQLEHVAATLQRLIDKRFVEHMVKAISRVLQNRAGKVNVPL